MIFFLILLYTFFNYTFAFHTPPVPFNNWHCIDFTKNIQKSKPFQYNIGNLNLITYFDKNNKPYTFETINNELFGNTILFQDKLWWTYDSGKKLPPTIYYHNKHFDKSYIKLNIKVDFIQCISNIMNINHPTNIHNNLFGLNNNIPPSNIQSSFSHNSYTISYSYVDNTKLLRTKNIIKLEYPYTIWSRVILPTNEKLCIQVNLLPLYKNETKLLISIYHNFWKSSLEKRFKNCITDLFLFKNSYYKPFIKSDSQIINSIFNQYNYPDLLHVENLYKYHLFNK